MDIGHVKHLLIRRARKLDRTQMSYGTVGAVAASDPLRRNLGCHRQIVSVIARLQGCQDAVTGLIECNQLVQPMDSNAQFAQFVAQDTLVLILG